MKNNFLDNALPGCLSRVAVAASGLFACLACLACLASLVSALPAAGCEQPQRQPTERRHDQASSRAHDTYLIHPTTGAAYLAEGYDGGRGDRSGERSEQGNHGDRRGRGEDRDGGRGEGRRGGHGDHDVGPFWYPPPAVLILPPIESHGQPGYVEWHLTQTDLTTGIESSFAIDSAPYTLVVRANDYRCWVEGEGVDGWHGWRGYLHSRTMHCQLGSRDEFVSAACFDQDRDSSDSAAWTGFGDGSRRPLVRIRLSCTRP